MTCDYEDIYMHIMQYVWPH